MNSASKKHALVVEGGAMRGIFAAGVLDRFLDHSYRPFDFCLGVSVGSTNLAAWLAHQRGRNYKVICDYSCRPEFMSLTKFLTGRHWFDLDWLWEITIREIRLDIKTFKEQSLPLYVVVTRVATGEADYIRATADNLEELLKASCSVPLLYRHYLVIGGHQLTDGGVADAIPVRKAYEMGARNITVVLSHPRGYQKSHPKFPWLIRRLFGRTPELAEALINRARQYNQSLHFIEHAPADCHIEIIAPPEQFSVGRMTTDQEKLQQGYNMGLEAASGLIGRRQKKGGSEDPPRQEPFPVSA